MMGQFRTVYSAEETPSDASEEEAQLTMGEPGFHLNLEEVVDDEPATGSCFPAQPERMPFPSFEGFFRKKINFQQKNKQRRMRPKTERQGRLDDTAAPALCFWVCFLREEGVGRLLQFFFPFDRRAARVYRSID